MKHLSLATITVALSLALVGCGGHDHKSGDKPSTSTSTSTSASSTSTAPVAKAKYTSYGGIVMTNPPNPADPPTISALLAKFTGNVDPAKIIQYAPGEVQNLPGYQGGGDGSASSLAGYQAWQIGGTYQKGGVTRAVAQKTVVISTQDAVYVLQLNADSLQSDQGPLMDATNILDSQTTITP